MIEKVKDITPNTELKKVPAIHPKKLDRKEHTIELPIRERTHRIHAVD